jgi:type VI secretion system protein ImpE
VATARELFDEGKLNQAIEALGAELRDHPTDSQRRTFLFELLCFSGNWDRADKQLDVLAGSLGDKSGNPQDRRMGALLYRAAIAAERTRHEMFAQINSKKRDAAAELTPVSGTLNGKGFLEMEDADPRIGARLEVLAGESYMWVPLEQIASITMEPPKKLRDLIWAPATVRTAEGFEGADLGEVLLPVISPFSGSHADDLVKLGRMTLWESTDSGDVPFGLKMLLVDGEEIPLLELRSLEISRPAEA